MWQNGEEGGIFAAGKVPQKEYLRKSTSDESNNLKLTYITK